MARGGKGRRKEVGVSRSQWPPDHGLVGAVLGAGPQSPDPGGEQGGGHPVLGRRPDRGALVQEEALLL